MGTPLAGRTALVTGAGSGIGHATALALATRGARVVVGCLDEAGGRECVEEIVDAGGSAVHHCADLRDESQVAELISVAQSQPGDFSIAVNNAGTSNQPRRLADITNEAWNETLAVNLTGLFWCLKYELRAMAGLTGCSVVNVASTLGLVGGLGLAPYVASKHGVVGLTRAASLEYAPRGVRINAVCPGYVPTQLAERVLGPPEEVESTLSQSIPLGRGGTPTKLAALITWLATDEASYMTGAVIAADGGATAQ
jgi:NAD(P)-dependent dehydrogenase (short-subunit alcohol dehydrogenase family)